MEFLGWLKGRIYYLFLTRAPGCFVAERRDAATFCCHLLPLGGASVYTA